MELHWNTDCWCAWLQCGFQTQHAIWLVLALTAASFPHFSLRSSHSVLSTTQKYGNGRASKGAQFSNFLGPLRIPLIPVPQSHSEWPVSGVRKINDYQFCSPYYRLFIDFLILYRLILSTFLFSHIWPWNRPGTWLSTQLNFTLRS